MADSGTPGNVTVPVPDWRIDADFTMPERVPWSVLGPQFATRFGRADPSNPQPEHIEIIGQNGSGKTHLLGKIYQERAFVYQGERTQIITVTKPGDETLAKVGFPIVSSFRELADKVRDGERALIYWPRTNRMGSARKRFHEARIVDLIDRIWGPDADLDFTVDDWGYAEKLAEVRERLEMLLREGRSNGISVAALKQRPQGSTRLMSSETQWTAAFVPKDRADLERWAELFGPRRQWMPVLSGMDPMRHEFLIRHSRTGEAAISWVDEPLEPVDLPRRKRRLGDIFGLGTSQ